jgi:hypothetical protein
VLLEPPWRNLALTDSAQDWHRWWTGRRIFDAGFSKVCEITSEYFCADAQRLNKHIREVNGDLANDVGADHPHGLVTHELEISKRVLELEQLT